MKEDIELSIDWLFQSVIFQFNLMVTECVCYGVGVEICNKTNGQCFSDEIKVDGTIGNA